MNNDQSIANNEDNSELAAEPIEDAIVYLLIDVSGSMHGSNIDLAKKGSREFAYSAIGKGHHVGLISFGSSADYICDPTDNKENIADKIKSLEIDGSTDMAAALTMVNECFADIKPDLATIVIVTDGRPDSEMEALEEAEKLKNYGVTIITIGTDDADEDFLQQIASASDLANVVENQDLGNAISGAADDLLMLGTDSN